MTTPAPCPATARGTRATPDQRARRGRGLHPDLRRHGQGSGATFHIYGLAAFHLDGIKAPSFKYTGTAPNNTSSPSCPGNACIWGYFTKAIIPAGTIDPTGDAPDLGLSVIQMIG